MNNKLKYLLVALIPLLGCVTSNGSETTELSNQTRVNIYDSCFEVVIRKSEKDSLTYEKELPWSLVPFNIRNDKYYSIGTAFAISETELLTAYHVLNLSSNSLIYNEYFIRDKDGNVYEVDKVLNFSNRRDFVKFTIKDRTFDTFLPLNSSYEVNEEVYSAGNAYGEGIILRKGNLLGTIPEELNGEWVKIRSSSDVNSGNSGGPLLNSQGEVIGVVIEKKDNIAYSLPISEVINTPKNFGSVAYNLYFDFELFPETSDITSYTLNVKLPKDYKEVIKEVSSDYINFYIKNMETLFKDNRSEIFPNGISSYEALLEDSTEITPQVVFKDESDLTWYISRLETSDSKLKNNGILSYSSVVENTAIFYIEKPDNIGLRELNSNPKKILDLVLEGLHIPRTIYDQETRITSFGKPVEVEVIKDDFNRTWQKSTWIVEYSDEFIVTYSMPTPEGVIVIYQTGNTGSLPLLKYNYDKMLNFIELSFYGRFKEWKEFLTLGDLIPDAFKDIKIERIDDSILIESNDVELYTDSSLLPSTDDTVLVLDFDIFLKKSLPIWDLRRVVVSEFQKDNYLVLYRQLKPNEGLRDLYHEEWKSTLSITHPFNNTPFQEDGGTSIGTLLDYKAGDIEPDSVFSLFIGKEGNIKDEDIIKTLDNIRVRIK